MEATTSLRPKFDTQFFERYAKNVLHTCLGEKYASLENYDRPDLQDTRGGLGVEVTRAIRETRADAVRLINDMAAKAFLEVPAYTPKELLRLGYTYGLEADGYVGKTEYDYWTTACTMSDIIHNKVAKVQNGFYGSFVEFGLFLFSRDPMSANDILESMNLTVRLQCEARPSFTTLFVFDIATLFVCHLDILDFDRYPVSAEMRRRFFVESL